MSVDLNRKTLSPRSRWVPNFPDTCVHERHVDSPNSYFHFYRTVRLSASSFTGISFDNRHTVADFLLHRVESLLGESRDCDFSLPLVTPLAVASPNCSCCLLSRQQPSRLICPCGPILSSLLSVVITAIRRATDQLRVTRAIILRVLSINTAVHKSSSIQISPTLCGHLPSCCHSEVITTV